MLLHEFVPQVEALGQVSFLGLPVRTLEISRLLSNSSFFAPDGHFTKLHLFRGELRPQHNVTKHLDSLLEASVVDAGRVQECVPRRLAVADAAELLQPL